MKDLIARLKDGLRVKIEATSKDGKETLETVTSKIIIVTDAIGKLKSFIIDYTFKNKDEEIEFFKRTKPLFYSELLYYENLLKIEIAYPVSREEKKIFHENEIHRLSSLLDNKRHWVTYHRTNATYLDEDYFMRNGANYDPVFSDHVLISDTRFCTIGSINISRILAIERLIKEIERRQAALDGIEISTLEEPGEKLKTLNWKGPKVGLVEFGRACKELGALDEPLKYIFECFSQMFNVNLDNESRTFQEILSRKKEEGVYLSKLLEGLKRLIERMNNSYKPKK